MKVDIGAALRRASPQGRIAYLRRRLDLGELRDVATREAIAVEVGELQAMLDAGYVPAPRKLMLRLTHVERRYLQALVDQTSRAHARYGSKLTDSQKRRLVEQYEHRVRDGQKYGAIKALARAFDVSERTVSEIVAPKRIRK
ncbi:hypothetical protein [Azohydromonas sp.]|uniref:hypothetical protein n=1 Tax=Azohydromonas sp. TaxID=1872666 RepID=UPI002B516090|nr:hypothetical protein [Azohydromonas sp.]HMM83909.1 hypothetical protein [Azohydromonas sp.]